ncbi:MAG: carbohydrate binding family 9 domain-containing protein, partial [Acidobacteriota bacterium]|nr:carbohydrate binding family 9 domain-containing protein [Acidobacteriota bacterium]
MVARYLLFWTDSVALGAIVTTLAASVLTPVPVLAQPPAAQTRETTPAGVPLARAHRVVRGPDVDGDVLGDAVWDGAPVLTGFHQNTPDEGEPASERTEVRIVYTDDTIYFGVVCYVRDPGTTIVSDARRDSSLTETDSFRLVLDTYQDQQNGFVFGTNPVGLEYDGQLTNAGQGSGGTGGGLVRRSGSQQQRGSGGGFNLNWDGVWQVRARISDIGWTA